MTKAKQWADRSKDRPAREEKNAPGFKYIQPPVRGVHPSIHILTDAQNKAQMTTKALARVAGLSPHTISAWRRGDQSASIAGVEACLNVFGLRLDVAPLEDKT